MAIEPLSVQTGESGVLVPHPATAPTSVGAAWGDKPDQWSDRIAAAHPMETGDHDTYGRAMEMVGNRHSKAALVELVNWLLKGHP